MLATKARRMLRLFIIAWLLCGAGAACAAGKPRLTSYNDPLTFGMTVDEVARLVDSPLIYLSGARGSERYLVERMSTVPGFYPVDTRIVLQFRRGRLTGWRRDWQMRPYWF
jgi:hypothetical protein